MVKEGAVRKMARSELSKLYVFGPGTIAKPKGHGASTSHLAIKGHPLLPHTAQCLQIGLHGQTLCFASAIV